jgi:hypothetical protein
LEPAVPCPVVPAVPVVEPESDGRQPTYVAVMNISPRDRRRTRFILKLLRTGPGFGTPDLPAHHGKRTGDFAQK